MYVPTKDTNIDNVFDIIYHKNFQNYLCEILDGIHTTYHIFNTYIFIEYAGYFSGNFTFFSLLALKPSKLSSPVFDDIYTNKLNEQRDTNFTKDMQYVIDIFLNIYQFPSHPIIEPTEESKNTHTNQEIIDLIVRTDIIRKETHNAISGYEFITKNLTTHSIISKLPFVYWGITIIEKNDTIIKLLDCIEKPDSCVERKPRSSRNSRSPNMSKTSKRFSLSPTIEGIAEYIPGSSPTPSPKRSTRRNTSLFDKTRRKYALPYKPSTAYKYKLRRFTYGKKRQRK
jgi:hypothetical protein